MTRTNITEKKFDEIITAYFAYGQKTEAIAKATGVSEKSIRNNCRLFKKMKDGLYEEVANSLFTDGSISAKAIAWSAERIGIAVPEVITNAIEKRKQINREKIEKKPSEVMSEETIMEELKTAPVIAEKNDALYFIKILEALNKQNELLEQLCDVVIPHWAADMKDNNNANCDILSSRLATAEKALECIKVNTRKRGL